MDEDELKEAYGRLQQAIHEDIPITISQSISHLAQVFCWRLKGEIEPLLNDEQLDLYEQIVATLGELLNNIGEDARGWILVQNFVDCGNILCEVFQFCQNAGQKCTGVTSRDNIAQKLPTIFKLAYQVVKLLTDTDRLGEALQNVDFLSSAFSTLIRCSEVLPTMDIMACIMVWKTLKKFYLSHRIVIGQHPTKFDSLFQVCTVTMSTMNELFAGLENKDEKFIGKYEKICRFFLSIVLLVVEDFRNVMDVESGLAVFKVIHQILKFSSVETRRQFEAKDCSSEYEMLYNNLLCVNEPLVKSFLQAECAVQCVMEGCRVTPDDDDSVSSAKLKLVVIVLEYLTEHPELHAKWFVRSDHIPQQQQQLKQKQQPASVLELVFTMVDRCSSCLFKRHTNLMVVDSTKSVKEVSLYQTLLGRLCVLVVTLDANHFQRLEQVLLSQLLHGNTTSYSVLLASDLWCFVARSGKPELCLGHFVFLGRLLMELNSRNGGGGGGRGGCKRNISCLLQRLFWFLEEDQHVEIVNTFPVHLKSVVLWKCLPVTQMKRVDTIKLSSQIVDTFLSTTEQVKETPQQQRCIIENVQCVTSLLNSDPSVYPQLEQIRRHAIVDRIVNFWRRFTVAEESVDVDVELITSMLALTSSVIVHLQGKLVSQVLHTGNGHTPSSIVFQRII